MNSVRVENTLDSKQSLSVRPSNGRSVSWIQMDFSENPVYSHFAFDACEALSSTAINLTWVHLQFDLNLSYDGGV